MLIMFVSVVLGFVYIYSITVFELIRKLTCAHMKNTKMYGVNKFILQRETTAKHLKLIIQNIRDEC